MYEGFSVRDYVDKCVESCVHPINMATSVQITNILTTIDFTIITFFLHKKIKILEIIRCTSVRLNSIQKVSRYLCRLLVQRCCSIENCVKEEETEMSSCIVLTIYWKHFEQSSSFILQYFLHWEANIHYSFLLPN